MSGTDVIGGMVLGRVWGSSPTREDGVRRWGLRRGRVRQAFEGGEATHTAQSRAVALRALGSWARRDGGSRVARRRTREPQLQPAQDGSSTAVKQTEGTHAVQAAKGHVLEESAEEFVRGQPHRFATTVGAVTIREGDGAVIAGGDGLVTERGAMDVAAKVIEDGARASDRLGEHDPALAPRDFWKTDTRERATSEMKEAAAEELGEGADGDQEGLFSARRLEPGASIGSESPCRHE
jgi:hypothetical protein